ncbi:MAG TPA: DNA methyltransferase [Bryobacteraceae bacterium]
MNDLQVHWWPIDKPIPYARNSRKIPQRAVDKVAASIKEFGWRVPLVVDKDRVLICGHTRLLAAKKLGLREVPVHVADNLSPAQVKAYRLMDNRSHEEADWDVELLGPELEELQGLDFDLSLTGFDQNEIDDFLADPDLDERANATPPLPATPVSRPGDLWLCGKHRVLCGDATSAEAVARLLGERKPRLLVTDPPYGIELDSEWRDRAGLNGPQPGLSDKAMRKARSRGHDAAAAQASYMKLRTEGHTETTISGDTRADWSEAFALVPSLEVAYVWHASKFTREVLDGLLRIGFVHHQQLVWDKQRTVLTRTLYWFQHEPCWFVRKKNAPWYGKAGENSTIWSSPSPKFIMGGSDEDKFDHPTQKPVELMRRPILNHLRRGELVCDPFLGSGTTLAAAEITERICFGLELDAKYVDVICQRYINLTGNQPTLDGDSRTFEEIAQIRRKEAA